MHLYSIQGWRFLYSSVRPASPPPDREWLDIPGSRGPLHVQHFFTPAGKHRTHQDAPALVVLSGFSARGHQDPRLLHTAACFARTGLDVYLPHIPSIEALELLPNTVEDIGEAITALSEHLDRPLAVFAVSLTAGMSLIAFAQPTLSRRVSTILSVGAYGDLARAVQFAMQNPGDAYGRLLLWYNFSERLFGTNPELRALLKTAIQDEARATLEKRLPGALQDADPESRMLFRRLALDPVFSALHWRELVSCLRSENAFLFGLNPRSHVAQLPMPVYLLHGKDDRVLPTSESEDLQLLLQTHGRSSRYLASTLIGHADWQWTLSGGLEALRLSGFISSFIREATKASWRAAHQRKRISVADPARTILYPARGFHPSPVK